MNLIKLNKSKILTEDNDKCIKLWDIQTGKYIMTIRNAFSYYIQIKINSTKILTACNLTISIWEITNGNGICLKDFDSLEPAESVVKISNTKILSLCKSYNIQIWDIINGNCINTINTEYVNIKFVGKFNSRLLICVVSIAITSDKFDFMIKLVDFNNNKNKLKILSEANDKYCDVTKINSTQVIFGIDKTVRIRNIYDYESL